MSSRVKRHVICLQMLNRTKNTKLRKAILEYVDADLISALCDCAHNILRGTVRLTPREKVRLRKYKDKLRLIANRRLSISRRHREIQPHCGGFLLALLALSTTSASTIRLNGTREEYGVGRSTTVGNVANPDTTTQTQTYATTSASTIRLNGTREEYGVGRSTTVGNVANPDTTTQTQTYAT